MSTVDHDDDAKDSRGPLTHREVFEVYLTDRELRPLLLGALGALAMIFLVLFFNGSDIGAVVVVLYGMAILAFRWTIAPPFFLLTLFWFQLFPFGFPPAGYENPFEIRETYFRVVDVVLVLSVLVYLRCLYRVFGVVQQAMPFENVIRRKGDQPVRRPSHHIEPSEIGWLVGGAFALAILGQIAWWLANAIEFAPTDEDFPLRWADNSTRAILRRHREPGEFNPGASRFFVILGALFFGLLFLRLIFGYWRLRMLNAAEGAMITTDTSWAESHRERVRVEKWRIWGREKVTEQARKAARAERTRRKKEAEAAERAAVRARRRAEAVEDDRPRRRRR
jgi:hypothetical protein